MQLIRVKTGDIKRDCALNRLLVAQIIAGESAKLQEKCVTFQKGVPKDERLDLENSEPTIASVVDMVTKMTNAWRAKRGKNWWRKVETLFIRFGNTLHSHKTMLELLPQGNEYMSVFTGALSAVLKVCYHL